MPETAKPREHESTAPSTGSGTPPSAPSLQAKEAPVIWPRDLNSPSTDKPEWGSDPETLRDA
ncbi:hypothetical protein [Corallococcus exercitus]|jgi:hypothetical protein|uniref:hypothetical protein n=1 Tax=Corallococcus exercitus TaxID=2316736 RepID=UPI0035D456E2